MMNVLIDQELPGSIPDLLHELSWLRLPCSSCSISILLQEVKQGLIDLI